MSQGRNEENELQIPLDDIHSSGETSEQRHVPKSTISEPPRGVPTRDQFPGSIDQNQIDSTERSQRRDEEAVWRLTRTIGETINQSAQKTKLLFSSACIYRVPENLRRLSNSAYTPNLIAIGPLHQYDRNLRETPMRDVKRIYVGWLILRLTKGIEDQERRANKYYGVLQECVKEMKKVVDDAKKSYTEEVWLNEEMMLVDGCFILELLYSYYDLMQEQGKKLTNGGASGNSKASSSIQQPHEGGDSTGRGDPIFDSLWIANNVKRDLLLLENQIPFFVLEKLFKLTVEKIPNCPHKRSLTDYVLFYFQDTMTPDENSKNSGSATTTSCGPPNYCVLRVSDNEITKNYYHILHLLHDNYLPSTTQKSGQKKKFSEFTLSAANLEYAGVKFKPLSENNPFDVEFKEDEGLNWWCRRASFEIPTIGIHDPTEPFLRNLIAFEQCCPGVSQHFTSYAFLMSLLINSQADVQVLKNAKVIKNYLGADEDTANLFNKLCKEVVIGDFYFANTCNRAFKYSEYCWPKVYGIRETYVFWLSVGIHRFLFGLRCFWHVGYSIWLGLPK